MKDRRITVRFTQDEYDFIVSSKENDKMKLSAYIRNLVLSKIGHSDVRIDKELQRLNYEIRKIGVNINQIANKLNANLGDPRDTKYVIELMRDIKERVETFEAKVQSNLQSD